MTEDRGPIRKFIPGYSRYQADTAGAIYRAGGERQKQFDTGSRMQVWVIRDDARAATPNVGSLVLRTFVGPPPMGKECSHLNGDYRDNRLENLAWETHDENMARKREHGTVLAGDRHGKTKLPDSTVLEIVRRLADGERGVDLAREYEVSTTTISGYRYGARVVLREAA